MSRFIDSGKIIKPKDLLQQTLRKKMGLELRRVVQTPPPLPYTTINRTSWQSVNESKPRHYLTIGAIFKDEAPYLREWIEFHLIQGVEKFYLYNNRSTDQFLPILMPYIQQGIVELRPWSYPPPSQVEAYHACIQTFGPYARWMAFIDIDEYLFPVNEEPLVDVLKRYEEHPALAVHWKPFATSGHVLTPHGLTLENFTRAPENISDTVKIIIDPRQIERFETPHSATFLNGGSAVTEDFKPIHTPSRYEPTADILRINHYWTRSVEEFAIKNDRGDSIGEPNKYNVKVLLSREHHCTVNDTLIQRYLPELKARLQARSADE